MSFVNLVSKGCILSIGCLMTGPSFSANFPLTSSSNVDAERERELLRDFEQQQQQEAPIPPPLLELPTDKQQIDPAIKDHKLFLHQLELSGVSLLDSEVLEQLKKEYEKREIKLAEAYEFVARVNKLYAEKGYFTCLAFLPAQKIKDGVIKVKVIEGVIEGIGISGNQMLDSEFILDQLDISTQSPPRLDELNYKLSTFSILRNTQLNTDFQAGATEGTTAMSLKVREQAKYSGQLYLDNYGSESNGKAKLGGIFRSASLSGSADPLTLGASLGLKKGTQSFFVDYNRPLTLVDNIGAFYSYSRSKVIQEPRASIGIKSKSHFATLNYSRVLSPWTPYFLQFRAGVDRTDSEGYVGIIRTENTGWRLWSGLDYAWSEAGQNLMTSLTYTYAATEHAGFSGEKKRDIQRWNLAASYRISSEIGAYAAYKGRAQFTTNERMPSTEKWSLGGVYSIRSLGSGVIAGDKGWEHRLSLGWTGSGLSRVIKSLDTSIYYEVGVVKNDQDLGFGQDSFSGAGIEVNSGLVGNLGLSMIWAHGFDMPEILDSESKLLAKLTYNF